MFKRLLSKPAAALLEVLIDGSVVATVRENEVACEREFSVPISRGSAVEFLLDDGQLFRHHFAHEEGWAHFSVRVGGGFACQPDCVVSAAAKYTPELLSSGKATGIRFQPFLLSRAQDSNEKFAGRGLFYRGLHYSGTVTPGYVSLACSCDACHKDFRLKSFHAGFSNLGYFYSGSSAYTLVVNEQTPGAPPALGKPDLTALRDLETRLPRARDGTMFKYMNPLRCPHCAAAYIDFERFPEQRENEYYGNTFMGQSVLRFDDGAS